MPEFSNFLGAVIKSGFTIKLYIQRSEQLLSLQHSLKSKQMSCAQLCVNEFYTFPTNEFGKDQMRYATKEQYLCVGHDGESEVARVGSRL